MMKLERSLNAWGTSEFEAVFKQEVAQFADQLPLQEGLSIGSHVTQGRIAVVIRGVSEERGLIRVRAGIFYESVIGGCSCDGDPTPVSENTEYCELQFGLDKASGATVVALLPEDQESNSSL